MGEVVLPLDSQSARRTKATEKRAMDFCSEYMTKSEIYTLKQFWYDIYPTGIATKKDFYKFASKACLDYDSESIDHMFRLLDVDKNGRITFLEFLWFQALQNPQIRNREEIPLEYLVDQAFLMYDENGDNVLSAHEIRHTMLNILKLNGQDVNNDELIQNVETRINYIFEHCGKNKDEKLTRNDLMKAVDQNPQFLTML
jgi:Ca2+-binding EF-hand superfamily protein